MDNDQVTIIGPDLIREAWTNDDMKILRRTARWAATHKLSLALVCQECEQQGMFGLDEFGQTIITCGCKRREMI